ncbi:hypothetical protein TrVE_jg13543 [Triparma verrucosa]|uniref:Uncharacterized protein n=1 Tax=Triparma verrucosa TaxID=1606542 RepID=A0A9W7FIV2_9STRA|nr:hypothetical protein TrVE_jg13543 [Triparma verrucosa]
MSDPSAVKVNPTKMFELPGGRNGWTALHNTVFESSGPFDVVKLMVEKTRGNRESRNILSMQAANGETALHITAATRRDPRVLTFLCSEYPPSIHGVNKFNALPIHFAAFHNRNAEVIRVLIEKAEARGILKLGSGLEKKCDGGNLPLHLAALASTSPEVVYELCKHFPGALNVKNNEGRTPIDIIEKYGKGRFRYEEVKSVLLSASFNFNIGTIRQNSVKLCVRSTLRRGGSNLAGLEETEQGRAAIFIYKIATNPHSHALALKILSFMGSGESLHLNELRKALLPSHTVTSYRNGYKATCSWADELGKEYSVQDFIYYAKTEEVKLDEKDENFGKTFRYHQLNAQNFIRSEILLNQDAKLRDEASICDVRPAMDENQKKRLAALMRVEDAEGKMGVLIKELSGKAVKA